MSLWAPLHLVTPGKLYWAFVASVADNLGLFVEVVRGVPDGLIRFDEANREALKGYTRGQPILVRVTRVDKQAERILVEWVPALALAR